MANSDKLVNLEDLGAAFDASLQKDFTQYDPAGQYTGNERIPLYLNGENYSTDMQTLLSSAGGGGSNQGAITDYKKVCGPISSLPWTSTADSNITSGMYLSYATSSKPSVLSVFDWSTSNDGTVTISAKNGGGAVTLSESVTLTLYFSVGMSTAPSILTNLGSNTEDNILKAAPRPGIYGTLGIANGGTNASSASAARTNLDVYSKSEVDTAITQSAAYKIKSGTNNIKNIIVAGYNTGSGNYFNVFIPCNIDKDLTITNITMDTSASKVFTSNGALELSGSSLSEVHVYTCGIAAEFRYTSPQTPNILINAFLINVVITCS